MIDINHLVFKELKKITKNDNHKFVTYVHKSFKIKELCLILEINRNRYYYLKRINKLDDEIIKKGESL